MVSETSWLSSLMLVFDGQALSTAVLAIEPLQDDVVVTPLFGEGVAVSLGGVDAAAVPASAALRAAAVSVPAVSRAGRRMSLQTEGGYPAGLPRRIANPGCSRFYPTDPDRPRAASKSSRAASTCSMLASDQSLRARSTGTSVCPSAVSS